MANLSTVALSTLITRMQRWSTIYRNTEEQYLVTDLDEALRNLQRTHATPWTLRKTTLRIFDGILEYPIPVDQMTMAYVENQQDGYENKERPNYTSIKEFYEDPSNLSQYASIWDTGSEFVGVRMKHLQNATQVIDSCEQDTGYAISGDITAKEIDNVFYKTGNGSLRLNITNLAGVATLTKTLTGISDTLYKRKYFFANIYLSGAPTSVTLRYGNDSSNYMEKVVTTQFSGQTFSASNFNILAFDLNNPGTTVGTIDSSAAFNYAAIIFNDAPTGLYYIDEMTVREWELMDYLYYSAYNVRTTPGVGVADQEYFMKSDGTYEPTYELVCPKEFADVIMYDAMLTTVADTENSKVYQAVMAKRENAWSSLVDNYPSLEPVIITHGWRFNSQMGNVVKWNEE